jgi:hypothetical protein
MLRLRFKFIRIQVILIFVQLFILLLLSTNNSSYYNTAVSLEEHVNHTKRVNNGVLLTNLVKNMSYPGPDLYTYYATLCFQLKPFYHVKPLIPEFGLVLNDVTSFRYPISIASCTRANNPGAISLFVAVVSAPSHFNERKVIRETWYSQWKELQDKFSRVMEIVGFAFVVGQQSNATAQLQLEKEATIHADILQVNMVDKYTNLSMKAAALLNWMKNDCTHADFLLKVDDDVYVNWHNLTAMVSKLSPSIEQFYGTIGVNLVVDRGILDKS